MRPSPPARRPALCALLATCLAAVVLSGASPSGWAQMRTFPDKTKVGMLQIGNFPEALLDGNRVVLAPGARILNEVNLAQTPMSVKGPQRVRYRLDSLGQIDLAWILTEAEALEAARK